MAQENVVITTADGDCPASLPTPAGAGPLARRDHVPGCGRLRGTFRDMGERLAGLGYVTLVPNIYYRSGAFEPLNIRTLFSDPVERQRLMTLIASLSPEASSGDAKAFIGFLVDAMTSSERPLVRPVTAWAARCRFLLLERKPVQSPQPLPSTAATSPRRQPGQCTSAGVVNAGAGLRGGSAGRSSFPPEQFERLDAALTQAGVRHTMETYPAGHGFAVPDNPTYDPAAEQRHWEALATLFAELPR